MYWPFPDLPSASIYDSHYDAENICFNNWPVWISPPHRKSLAYQHNFKSNKNKKTIFFCGMTLVRYIHGCLNWLCWRRACFTFSSAKVSINMCSQKGLYKPQHWSVSKEQFKFLNRVCIFLQICMLQVKFPTEESMKSHPILFYPKVYMQMISCFPVQLDQDKDAGRVFIRDFKLLLTKTQMHSMCLESPLPTCLVFHEL